MCRQHISFKTVGGGGKERSARDSTSSITRFATTTETDEPMAVPCTCRQKELRNAK